MLLVGIILGALILFRAFYHIGIAHKMHKQDRKKEKTGEKRLMKIEKKQL